ncbi:MAG: phage tail protein [Stellaceae bacterium]
MELVRIRQLLPGIFRRTLHEGGPLFAILKVMEALHEPSEAILRSLDAVFDPRRTRADFLPFLAHWVDLHHVLIDPSGEERGDPARLWAKVDSGRLRELIANAALLSQWRGTAKGLQMFLTMATGETGFVIDEQVPDADKVPRPFHFRVRIPKSVTEQLAMIDRIIQSEKPAYVTYETELY